MVGVMGHVTKSGQLGLRDINKSCVLIISAEKKRLLSSTPGEALFCSKVSSFIRLPYVNAVWLYFIYHQNLSESLGQHGYYSTCIETVYVYIHLSYTDQNKLRTT